MRVLLWMPLASEIPGGHRVQMEQTAAHLGRAGVEVKVSFEPEEPVEQFDIMHCFSLPLAAMRRCRQAGVSIALSSIYWSRSYTSGQDATQIGAGEVARAWAGRLRSGAGLLRAAMSNSASEACEKKNAALIHTRVAYEMADLILPNSRQEAESAVRELGITTPLHIVPNAVDPEVFSLPPDFSWQKWDPARVGVLYAGRIEPHKNQLGLIRAWNSSAPPLTVAGPPHPHHPKYYEQCCREAERRGVQVLAGVPHHELPDVYRRARVHIVPSWFETTGLVSLEAALCGCNIVTTSRGYAREYFDDLVWYCNPAQPATILQAAIEAHAAPPRPQLHERILSFYTWENTARATLEGYKRLAAQRKNFQRGATPHSEKKDSPELPEQGAEEEWPQISGRLRPDA